MGETLSAQPFDAYFGEPAPSKQGKLKDFGDQIWASTLGIGEGLTGAVSYGMRELGASPDAIGYVEEQRQSLTKHIADTVSGMSPTAQQAMRASLFGGGDDEHGNHIPTPGEVGWIPYISANLASLVPQLALAVIPGGVAGRAVTALASRALGTAGLATAALETGTEAAAALATRAATTAGRIGTGANVVTTGTTMGSLQAGTAYGALVDALNDASPEEMMKSAPYVALMEQPGMTDLEARKQLLAVAARPLALQQFALGAVTGVGAERLLTQGALGVAKRGAMTRIGVGAAEGAVVNSAQSGGADLLQQQAEQKTGLTQALDTSRLARAFASGATVGAVIGGVGGGIHKEHVPQDPRIKDDTAEAGGSTSFVAKDVEAAMDPRTAAEQAPPVPSAEAQAATGAPAGTTPPPGSTPPPGTTPPAGTAPPAPTVTPPDNTPPPPIVTPAKTDRQVLIEELTTRGQNPEKLKRLGKTALQKRLDKLKAAEEAAAQPSAETAEIPPVVPAVEPEVKTPEVSPAVEAPTVVPHTGIEQPTGVVHDVNEDGTTTPVVTPAPEPTAEIPVGVRQEGGPAPGVGEAPVQATTPVVDTPAPVVATPAPVVPKPEPEKKTKKAVGKKAKEAKEAEVKATATETLVERAHVADAVLKAHAEGRMPDIKPEQLARAQADVKEAQDALIAEAQRAEAEKEKAKPAPKPEVKPEVKAEEEAPAPPAPELTPAEKRKAQRDRAAGRTTTTVVTERAAVHTDESVKADTAEDTTTRSTAAVAPAPIRAKEATAAERRTTNTQNLAAAVAKVKLDTLGKSTDTKPIRNQIQADLGERIGKTDGTVEAIHQALAEWVSENKGKVKGTTTGVNEVANHIAELMTGKPLPDRKGFTLAARAESATKARDAVYEGEKGARKADVAEAHAADADAAHVAESVGAGEAAADHAPTVGGHAETTVTGEGEAELSDKIDRRLPVWLDRVLQGTMTAKEADEAYRATGVDSKETPTFAHYVEAQIKHAEDPAVQDKLRDALIDAQKAELTAAKEARQGTSIEDRETGTRQEKAGKYRELHNEMAKVGPEAAEKLRAIKKELDELPARSEPVEVSEQDKVLRKVKVIERGKGTPDILRAIYARARILMDGKTAETEGLLAKALEDHGVTIEQVKAVEARIAKLHDSEYDAVVGKLDEKYGRAEVDEDEAPVHYSRTYEASSRDWQANAVMDRLLNSGTDRPLKDYLDAIANDDKVADRLKPYRWLARRLRALVDSKLKVHLMNDPDEGFAGAYYSKTRGSEPVIHLNDAFDAGSRVSTLVHEAMHSVTANYIDHIAGDKPIVGNWDNVGDHRDMRALKAIRDELQAALDHYMPSLPESFARRLEYALSDPHELHTMLMTDPDTQRIAASWTVSSGFRETMRELGYGEKAVKSVWHAFATFLKRAMGITSKNSVHDSLLDHVLRPITEITDRGAEFNRRNPNYTHTSFSRESAHALSIFKGEDSIAAKLGKKLDWATMGDSARRGALVATTTNDIVKWNREIFNSKAGNSLETWRDANEAIAARSAAFHDKWADRVTDIIKRYQGPDRDKLASLMNAATMAKVHAGTGADPVIDRQYDALNPQARQVYRDARAYFSAAYAEEREAQLNGMVKLVLPGATEAQKKELRVAAKTPETLDAFLEKIGADVGWEKQLTLVRGIAQLHRMGFVQGDYFPLRRHGDYVLRYGSDADGDYGVEMFDKRGDAEARRAEVVRELGSDAVQPIRVKEKNGLNSLLPDSKMVAQITDAMAKDPALAPHADAMRQLANAILLQHATNNERVRSSMRRRGVKGASLDIERTLAQDFVSTAGRIGHLEHGPETYQAIAEMRRHADTLKGRGEQIRAAAVIDEVERRMPLGDDPSKVLPTIARKMTGLGYVQSMMSPAHALYNSLGAHMIAGPMLGARHGVGRTSLALAKALKDVTPTALMHSFGNTFTAGKAMFRLGDALKAADWNMSHVMRDALIKAGADKANMTDLFNRFDNAGLINHNESREMLRIAKGGDVRGGIWGKFLAFNAAGIHAVDSANKAAIGKAAYDLEMKKSNGDHVASAKYAVQAVRDAMPNYNLANKARISTDQGPLGAYGAPVTQFRQFGFHMYGLMANLAKASIHGADKKERMEKRLAFAGVLATHALMAGSLTLIADPLRWIGGLYDLVTGADKPHNYQADVRDWMADAFGPEVGEVVARGVPRALGLDLHRNIGIDNLLSPPELKSFDLKGFTEALGTALMGASGQDAATMAGAVTKFANGKFEEGFQDMAPRIVRDVIKAHKLATKGVTDASGKTIYDAEHFGAGDIAAQAFGFQGQKVAEYNEGRYATMERRDELEAARSKLMKAYVEAEPEDRADAREAIRDYNDTAPPGARIKTEELLQARQTAKRNAKEGAKPGHFGLQLPKAQSRYLSEAGRFANVPQ